MNKTSEAQQTSVLSSLTPTQGILQRKCSCGNKTVANDECIECANKKVSLQRKLSIGASNDPLEYEADRVSDQVMSRSSSSVISNAPVNIQRISNNPSNRGEASPSSVDSTLASLGSPMQKPLRQNMEQRFGHDFSKVRIHTGNSAARSASDINARAYTVGNNIVFNSGEYVPNNFSSNKLLAHELTHVVQQNSAVPKSLLQKQERTGTESNRISTEPEITSSRSSQNLSRYRIHILGHASPRWRRPGASTQEQRNLELSERRTRTVENTLRTFFQVREPPVEFSLSSRFEEDDTNSIEPDPRGISQTLEEANGDRTSNDSNLRRVDIKVDVIRQTTETGGFSEPVSMETRTRDWSINVDVIEGAFGAAGSMGTGVLKNRRSGQTVRGKWIAGGGGGGIDLPVPSVSPGSWVNFTTVDPLTFSSFEDSLVRYTTIAGGIAFGYGTAEFKFTSLMDDSVTMSGFVVNQWGAGGSVTAGPWNFTQNIPEPPIEIRQQEIIFLTSFGTQFGHTILFDTAADLMSERQNLDLGTFVEILP